MTVAWQLGDRLALTLDDPNQEARARLEVEMNPYEASGSTAEADVALEAAPSGWTPPLTEIQNPARDGVVTAVDGTDGYVLSGRAWCRVVAEENAPARFTYSAGFPLFGATASLVRAAMQQALYMRGAVALHAAAVEVGGGGVAIAGWSESGKTETALALMESGARFLSDKWTVLGDDRVLRTFPIGVGIRRWVLRYLPRLRASLPAAALAQFVCAAAGARITRPLRGGGGLVSAAAERVVRLADRAGLQPTDVIEAYGQSAGWLPQAPFSALVLLTTGTRPTVEVREMQPSEAAHRLAHTAAFERRGLFEFHRRVRFALPSHRGWAMSRAIELEREFLTHTLSGARLLETRAPFPGDPRRVRDAIRKWL